MTNELSADSDTWASLVAGALARDESAWRQLVDRLTPVVWKVLSSYRLSPDDREDAYASTFFRLYDKLHTVNDPVCLPGWIATAAKNEANALWRRRARLVPTDRLPLREVVWGDLAEALLDREDLHAALRAFERLSAEHQALLRLYTAVPKLSYDEISALLGIPKGSIGPTIGRIVVKLKRSLKVADDKGGKA